ncbi:MAG: SDR family NAD(P)-dependent oxidoreductase [Chthoniobacterales bacterium]|nr:SDR family NAD(P)-dependent oxidoreductase [Chthoniobacterales bacterium]
MDSPRVALVTGVGPGLGAALARRFAREGFALGLVARQHDFIDELARELSANGRKAIGVAADVSRPEEIQSAVARVRAELGKISVLLHNASSSSGAGLLGTTPEEFESSWRIASLGGFVSARETAPDMIEAGAGAMIFTGATSSVRGGGWLAFSSAKFALRGLVQSLARELWPKGVHVAHVVVDGIIGVTGEADTGEPALDPDQMAEAYWQLARQDRAAWTLELDLRPHGEKFFE